MTDKQPKLLNRMRGRIRAMQYSIRTEDAYIGWVKRFIVFHEKRHPRELGKTEVEAFLTHLALDRKVAASTQSQAKAALLFLYQKVLEMELPWLSDLVEAKPRQRLPKVLTVAEVRAVLGNLSGIPGLISRLLYGSGLRVLEACRLRVQDLDFGLRQIVVRNGKGAKDRVTMLPVSVIEPLMRHLTHVKGIREDDLRKG